MAQPFLGEIKLFAGNFQIRGWAFCDGRLLSIAANSALFALLGTTYGGDGQTTFGLPDLRSRVPLHQFNGPGLTPRTIGELSGTETVTLTTPQMPSHSHVAMASTTAATLPSPVGNLPGKVNPTATAYSFYVDQGTSAFVDAPMASASVTPAGGSQPHDNVMPTLALNYIISLEGVFPLAQLIPGAPDDV